MVHYLSEAKVKSLPKAGATHQIQAGMKSFKVYTFKPEHTVFHWGT